jgi:uncharacterized OB-fold protein
MPDLPHAPIADDLLEQGADGIVLLASRERTTGRMVFPARPAQDASYERVALPREGQLWSWTVQRFRPKSPPYAGLDAFEPYAVGYVQLDGALIVEARLVDVSFAELRIGLPMQLVPLSFPLANGQIRTSFAFAPARKATS